MNTYLIKFKHGQEYEFQASRMDDTGERLTLYDDNDDIVISYLDSDISSCRKLTDD